MAKTYTKLAFLVAFFAFLAVPAISGSVHAGSDTLYSGEINVVAGVESVLRVTLPSDIVLKIDPGRKEPYTVPINLGIYTNNPDGYLSYMTVNELRADESDNAATALVNTTDSQYLIDSLTDETPISKFPAGYWGYSVDGGFNFEGLPAANETPAYVNTDEGLYFGVKVPEFQASGVYATTIVVSVVTRHVQTQDDLFNGIHYMQEMTQEICETENAGSSKQLIDSRDGKKYWVTRMRDNSCWMTQNLDFEISENGTTLTPADTNVFSTKVLTRDTAAGGNNIYYQDGGDYYVPNGADMKEDGTTNFVSTAELEPDAKEWHYQVGSMYSWPAATANSGKTDEVIYGEAEESICPSGWRLPVYNQQINTYRDYSFYKLFQSQPEARATTNYSGTVYKYGFASVGTGPFYFTVTKGAFTRSDYFIPLVATTNDTSTYGGYWTSTAPYNLRVYEIMNLDSSYTSYQDLASSFSRKQAGYYRLYNDTSASSYTEAGDYRTIFWSYGGGSNIRRLSDSVTGGYLILEDDSDEQYYGGNRNKQGLSVRCVSAKHDLYSISTMQEVTPGIVKNTDVESAKLLTDVRDGKQYWVTKEYDGNLWMTQNLDFEVSYNQILDPSTSDVLTRKTISPDSTYYFYDDVDGFYSRSEGNYFYNDQLQLYYSGDNIYTNVPNSTTLSALPGQRLENHFKLGTFYSWNAATAESGANVTEDGGVAEESICPKGWSLPTNNGEKEIEDGSYDNMVLKFLEVSSGVSSNYSGGLELTQAEAYYRVSNAAITASPLFIHYTGEMINNDSSRPVNADSVAAYWSSRLKHRGGSNDTYAYQLRMTDMVRGNYTPSEDNAAKTNYGAKVRCVANTEEGYTVSYDANGGTDAPESQSGNSVLKYGHKVQLSAEVPTNGDLEFAGWATDPDAAVATYQAGETVTINQSQVILYAVWKPAVVISFNANTGTGTMADQNIPSGTTKNLRKNTIYKPGYLFLGWSTNASDTTAIYANEASYTAPSISTSTNVTLYAIWEATVTLQTFNCSSLTNIGDSVTIPDIRDGEMYEVRKMEDGNCWMMTNVRLDLSNLQQDISATNTNNPTAKFISDVNLLHPASTDGWCTDFSEACDDKILYNTVNIGDQTVGSGSSDNLPYDSYGIYYNYYTATAGHDGYESMNHLLAAGDLCPYGWHMPTGTSYGELANLASLGGTASFAYGGNYYASGVSTSRSHVMYYWILDKTYSKGMGPFYTYSGTGFSNSSWPQYYGSTMRCVADHDQSFTITYDANNGSGAPAAQTITSGKGKGTFTISNIIPTRAGYSFVGWSESAYAQDADYNPGQMIAFTQSNITLYAVWAVYFHDFSCSSLTNVGDSITLKDIRDGVNYNVAKLADGKCWMTENLRLNFANLKENMTTSNTNNPTSSFMAAVNSRPSPVRNWCSEQSQSCYDQVLFYNSYNGGSNGFHYNWYTATAGRGYNTTGYADGDICPYGWHLPTGGTDGDFAALSNALGGYQVNDAAQYMSSTTSPTGSAMGSIFHSSPNNFMNAGYHYQSGQYINVGRYWTSSAWNNNTVRGLYINDGDTGYVDPGVWYGDYKYRGYSVRCLKN
ncbi:InlB B-repeat-containing protein [Candidatus Saccharibacteria bacterium]|nr:InlB B-repeat-containing protein [Candidatus Saccharibacteria bacterium]